MFGLFWHIIRLGKQNENICKHIPTTLETNAEIAFCENRK